MLQRLIGAALLLTAIILPSADLRAQNPAKPANPPAPKDSSKLPQGEYTGVLKATPGSDRMFVLTITTQSLVPTGKMTRAPKLNIPGQPNLNNAYNKVATLQTQYINQQNAVANAKNAKARQSAANKLNQIGNQLQNAVAAFQQAALQANIRNLAMLSGAGGPIPQFTVKTNKEDVEFQTIPDPKVRTMFLPEVFDDKGEIKKYTPAEKAELKGKDKSLPGYESSLEKLEAGQTLKVTLVPVKTKKAAPPEKNKENDKEEKPAVEEEKKMQVKMIVITKEANGTVPDKKKKNN
jgi:hypothetical protein